MFRSGDQVEREIDGMFFEASVKTVHKPPPRNPDSRGQRRCYSYDILYPDTKNTELNVPEDEIRLKVGRRRGSSNNSSGSSKTTETSDTTTNDHHKYSRYGTSNQSISTVAPSKNAYVLVGEQEHEGVPHTTTDGTLVDEGKRDDSSNTANSSSANPDPFAATLAETEQQKKSGKVNVHHLDDNERFQSTGSAYITHGHVGDSVKTGASGGGGGGLRAIRMLRK